MPGTTAAALAKLEGLNGMGLSVTAGIASGVNDGAAALLLASEAGSVAHGLAPMAQGVTLHAVGGPPWIMGVGLIPAPLKARTEAGLGIEPMDVIDLIEAFARQALATLRGLGLADNARHVNRCGGAIAMVDPLGMSGTRLVLTAACACRKPAGAPRSAPCGSVGQGVAVILERV